MLSAGIGGILHGGVQLSRDIYAVADTDTVLGAKIRLYHQELATHSSLFPYFKNETFRAIHHRDKMNKD